MKIHKNPMLLKKIWVTCGETHMAEQAPLSSPFILTHWRWRCKECPRLWGHTLTDTAKGVLIRCKQRLKEREERNFSKLLRAFRN